MSFIVSRVAAADAGAVSLREAHWQKRCAARRKEGGGDVSRAKAFPPQEHGRNHRQAISRAALPVSLALQHSARVEDDGGGGIGARSALSRIDGNSSLETIAGWWLRES